MKNLFESKINLLYLLSLLVLIPLYLLLTITPVFSFNQFFIYLITILFLYVPALIFNYSYFRKYFNTEKVRYFILPPLFTFLVMFLVMTLLLAINIFIYTLKNDPSNFIESIVGLGVAAFIFFIFYLLLTAIIYTFFNSLLFFLASLFSISPKIRYWLEIPTVVTLATTIQFFILCIKNEGNLSQLLETDLIYLVSPISDPVTIFMTIVLSILFFSLSFLVNFIKKKNIKKS